MTRPRRSSSTWKRPTAAPSADDGLRLADIYYNISRSIERGSLEDTSPSSDPDRRKELAAKVVHYARAAYDQAKKYEGDPDQIGTLGTYLCHVLIHHEPNPDYAAIEAIAREARVIREKLYGVGGRLDTHPLNYLLIALARQDKIDELERVFLDLLARKPQPKWDDNASYCLAPRPPRNWPAPAKPRRRCGCSNTPPPPGTSISTWSAPTPPSPRFGNRLTIRSF